VSGTQCRRGNWEISFREVESERVGSSGQSAGREVALAAEARQRKRRWAAFELEVDGPVRVPLTEEEPGGESDGFVPEAEWWRWRLAS